jgi:hypothetical protein
VILEIRNARGAKSASRLSKWLLTLLAPRHPRVLRNQDHAPNTGGLAISWLEAPKNLGPETTQEKRSTQTLPLPLLLNFQNP